VETINMSAKPRDSVSIESDKNLIAEAESEDGLVDMGKVSETEGGFFGPSIDTGGEGYREG
jgi:hypothetical protein